MPLEIGHYTARAIPDLLQLAQETSRSGDKERMAMQVTALALSLRHAQKFFLPDGGELFDTKYTALPATLRLPYPHTCIEHSDKNLESYSRRIILAMEHEKHIQVTMVSDTPDRGWVPLQATARIIRDFDGGGRPGIEVGCWNDHAQRKYKHAGIMQDVFDTMHDCVRVVLSLLEVLQCSNVTTETVTPSAALNKKRARNGKEPFDSYHVLKIPTHATRAEDQGGSHASPRQHLRRGHVRRLATDKTTWVNATIVGSAKNGTVTKDYRVPR